MINEKDFFCSWSDYEENFIKFAEEIKSEGIDHGVFGDIDLEDHRAWFGKEINQNNPQS